MREKLSDLKPFFGGFGEYLKLAHEERWADEQAPDGSDWDDLAPETWKRRKYPDKKKLVQEGHMLSIRGATYDAQTDQLLFGMSDKKAPWHHYGTQNREGKNMIPERPLVGMSDADNEELIEQAKEYLTDGA